MTQSEFDLYEFFAELRDECLRELGIADELEAMQRDTEICELIIDKIRNKRVLLPSDIKELRVKIHDDFAAIIAIMEDGYPAAFGFVFNVTYPDLSEYSYIHVDRAH